MAGTIETQHQTQLGMVGKSTFDPDGDLTLIVGSGVSRQKMQVDSHALCRLSSVLRRMLRGNFLESKPESGPWIVNLPRDDPGAFAAIMDIVHGQFDQSSRHPTLSFLTKIVLLVDKYDMAKALRPVAQKWFNHVRPEAERPLLHGRESVLFVAWELGHAEVFDRVARRIATEYSADAQGDILSSSGSLLKNDDVLGIPNVLENIKAHRVSALAVLRQGCGEMLGRLMRSEDGGCRHRGKLRKSIRQECRYRVLGCLLNEAQRLCITDVFIPQGVECDGEWTAKDILTKLDTINETLSGSSHPGCNPLKDALAQMQKKIVQLPSPRSAYHYDYMKIQQAATGV